MIEEKTIAAALSSFGNKLCRDDPSNDDRNDIRRQGEAAGGVDRREDPACRRSVVDRSTVPAVDPVGRRNRHDGAEPGVAQIMKMPGRDQALQNKCGDQSHDGKTFRR